MKALIILMIVAGFLIMAATIAMADSQTATAVPINNVTVVKPMATAGSYGTGAGQIDTPLCIRVDSEDNIIILQAVHIGNGNIKTVISEYSRNLTFIRSFDVLKQSTSYQLQNPAGNGFYYDDLATSFAVDNSGKIYILCGWDIVVYDMTGKYLYQFPDNSFMGWIGSASSGTSFYYPQGMILTDDGDLLITSGSSPDKQEAIFITPDGKLSDEYDLGIQNMQDIEEDVNGSFYVTQAGSNVIHEFDHEMDSVTLMPLNFPAGYTGSPSSIAFFSDGNIAASANGVSIFYPNSTLILQFMDNNVSPDDKNWERPIAVNSTDALIVVSGMNDSAITPQPIEVYQYQNDWIAGAQVPAPGAGGWMIELGILAAALVIYAVVAFYFILRRYL